MAISTNQKPTIYRNLYENTAPGSDKWSIAILPCIAERQYLLFFQVSSYCIFWLYTAVLIKYTSDRCKNGTLLTVRRISLQIKCYFSVLLCALTLSKPINHLLSQRNPVLCGQIHLSCYCHVFTSPSANKNISYPTFAPH